MIQTVEAIIDETGKVQLLEAIELKKARRALVTILEEEPAVKILEQSRTTKSLVAKGWNGLRWGATISEFRTAFPQAAKSGECWVTGLGHSSL